MSKRWSLIVLLFSLAVIFHEPIESAVEAATDVLFVGRGIRATRVSASTCSNSAQSCIHFDTSARPRFWNGSTWNQMVTTPSPSPISGAILVGDGTNWNELAHGTANQVLSTHITDGGVVTLTWIAN